VEAAPPAPWPYDLLMVRMFAFCLNRSLPFIHLPPDLPPVIQPMEIVFKAPTLPQSLLNLDDSLAQRTWETSWALLCAIRDATFATYLEEKHRSLLLGSLKALQVQESFFRPVLRNLTVDWVPTAKEEQIIQAAYHGFYPVDDIEGAFYKYGGLYGIVALVLVFRDTYSILKQWAAIDVEAAQQWLVSNVAQLFACKKNKWIDNFIPQGTPSL
jgi:hypothetical protein